MPTLTFLIDVDNTLIDNDAAKKDFETHLEAEVGPQFSEKFWKIYEQVRQEKDVVDIPTSLTRLREQVPENELDEVTFQHAKSIFLNYPFHTKVYPHVIGTLKHLCSIGPTVIVSDGDQVFQAEKVFSSNLAEVVEGRVLIYVHKQDHLEEIQQKYPADHYVMIDDKARVLDACKKILGDRLTTVFVKQGHYAAEPFPSNFIPELSVNQFGELLKFTTAQFLNPGKENL